MQTTTPSLRSLFGVISFAAVGTIAAIATWVLFGGSMPFQATAYDVTALLPDATSLYAGSQVQISGVTVGKVSDVALGRRGGVKVTLAIDPAYAPLHAGARLILRTKTLLGEGFIQLTPGARGAPLLPDGGQLAPTQVLAQQRLQDVLETFRPATRVRIRQLFTGVARAFGGRSQALSDALGLAAPTAESLSSILGTLASERPSLRALIANAGTTFDAVGRREGQLRAAITAGDQVLGTTAAVRTGLGATIDALPPLLHTLKHTDGTLQKLSAPLSRAVAALQPVVPVLAPALSAIDATAPTFRAVFTRLPATLAAGEQGLPTLRAILDAAPPAFSQVYSALRQMTPIAELASASRASLIGSFADVGNITNGTMMLGSGQSVHYANGLPTFWNETIAGWTKRLPSNRMNAYPTTADLAGEASRGALQAYDCRNLHNHGYLPPLGTGTPPCLVQGPYLFDGRMGQYPRLYLAPK